MMMFELSTKIYKNFVAKRIIDDAPELARWFHDDKLVQDQ